MSNVSADLWLRITLGASLFAALCAVCWMMFHGRQFLPDAVRQEFRESQRRRGEQFRELARDSRIRGLLASYLVVTLGSALARSKIWHEPSWRAAFETGLQAAVPFLVCGGIAIACRRKD